MLPGQWRKVNAIHLIQRTENLDILVPGSVNMNYASAKVKLTLPFQLFSGDTNEKPNVRKNKLIYILEFHFSYLNYF